MGYSDFRVRAVDTRKGQGMPTGPVGGTVPYYVEIPLFSGYGVVLGTVTVTGWTGPGSISIQPDVPRTVPLSNINYGGPYPSVLASGFACMIGHNLGIAGFWVWVDGASTHVIIDIMAIVS